MDTHALHVVTLMSKGHSCRHGSRYYPCCYLCILIAILRTSSVFITAKNTQLKKGAQIS